jgi:hypothetical protein
MVGRASTDTRFETPDHPEALSRRILIRRTESRGRDQLSTGVRGVLRRS